MVDFLLFQIFLQNLDSLLLIGNEHSYFVHVLVKYNPRGGTQHMHIRGGKSDISGSEYCQK